MSMYLEAQKAKEKKCIVNSVPFVFKAPLAGSPPSIVCPSPVSRSFRESISRRTVKLAQATLISTETLPGPCNHLVNQSTPEYQYS